MKIEKLGSAKRFGARYGKKPKQLFAEIEKLQRAKHKCPYCHYIKVRRLSYGIWHCKKCNSKFTGKAYTISEALPGEKAKIEEQPVIEAVEESQNIEGNIEETKEVTE